jgi:hypothetical protein
MPAADTTIASILAMARRMRAELGPHIALLIRDDLHIWFIPLQLQFLYTWTLIEAANDG